MKDFIQSCGKDMGLSFRVDSTPMGRSSVSWPVTLVRRSGKIDLIEGGKMEIGLIAQTCADIAAVSAQALPALAQKRPSTEGPLIQSVRLLKLQKPEPRSTR